MASSGNIRLCTGQQMPTVAMRAWLLTAETMRTAIDIGYRHIDIAQNYDNEDKLGQVLEEQIEAGKLSRKDVFITTKLSPIAYAPEHVRRETEKSLKRLRTDYIDLYLMHFPVSLSDEGIDNDPPTRFPTYENGTLKTTFVDHMLTWKEMEKLVDDGLVKAIGLTNFTMKQTQRLYTEARIKPANVQIEIHAWFPQYDLVEFCLKRGISVTAYGPTGSPDIPDCIKMGPPVPPLLNEPLLKEIAGRHKKTPSQVLLRNLIQRGITVIPKCVAEEEMRQNLQVFDFQLTDDEMLEIKGLNKELRIFVFKMFGKQNFRHPYFPWPELIDQCEI